MKEDVLDAGQAATKERNKEAAELGKAERALAEALRSCDGSPESIAALRPMFRAWSERAGSEGALGGRQELLRAIGRGQEAAQKFLEDGAPRLDASAMKTLGMLLEQSGQQPSASQPKPLHEFASVRKPNPVLLPAEGENGPWVNRGEVAVLSGEGGQGKSTLAMQWAVGCCAAKARNWPEIETAGMACKQGGALLVSFEDHEYWLYQRATNMLSLPEFKDIRIAPALEGQRTEGVAVLDSLEIWPAFDLQLYGVQEREHLQTRPGPLADWDRLWEHVRQTSPALVVLDPATAAYTANPNAVEGVRAWMTACVREARKADCAVLVIAHSAKTARGKNVDDAGKVGGSAAWTDAARLAMFMTSVGSGLRQVQTLKTNYGRLRTFQLRDSILDNRLLGFTITSESSAAWTDDEEDPDEPPEF